MKKGKKKQKNKLIEFLKIFIGALSLLSTILALISFTYVPPISLEIESPSDNSDSFSAPLIVSNNSPFRLAKFSFYCAVWDIGQSIQTSSGTLNSFVRVKLENSVSSLESGGRVTIQNRIIQLNKISFKKEMLQIDVEYYYSLLPFKPFKFHRTFKFSSDYDADGHFRWLPI